ncbi:MAG: Fic family protein [Natronospirillum sp.]
MRIPKTAPSFDQVLQWLDEVKDSTIERQVLTAGMLDDKQRYTHWEKLRFKKHPEGLSAELWWAGLKIARCGASRKLAVDGIDGAPLRWCEPLSLSAALHQLDMHAAGTLKMDERVNRAETRNTYIVRSLIEEAITSSQLEGASTTLVEAKEMLRQNRQPRTKDETMIRNNYQVMSFIREQHDTPLTSDMVLELHRMVTEDTLEQPERAGVLRQPTDPVMVVDTVSGDVLHTPPAAESLAARLKFLCDFANGSVPGEFIHPVLRAIITHFLLAYDHPFVDGNGRTARALFYWVMLRNGYWLMEFITISKIIKRAPRQYGQAFLHTETDENDMTYFIFHQLGVIKKAVEELQEYLDRKQQEMRAARELIAHSPRLNSELNARQLGLLRHALENPRHAYRIEDHMRSHGITYETARRDLLSLADLKLLGKVKQGRTWLFPVPSQLRERLVAR